MSRSSLPASTSRVRVCNERYEVVAVERLTPHPKNPRRGDVGAIAKSIAKNGFYGAVVAQSSTGYILAGNHRYEAAKREGATEVPVVWVDVDDKTARRILLADNKTNDVAGYDDEALAAILEAARNDGDLLGTGYDDDDLDKLLGKMGDEIIETAERNEVGDIRYQLVVECSGETQQAELLARLEAEGLKCKPLLT
jgi:ParB-like chromosome segregation protein Spo0J